MKLHVTINGTAYPCELDSLGAARLYEKTFRKPYTAIDYRYVTDITDQLWAGVADMYAAQHGKDFGMDADTFARSLTAEDLAALVGAIQSVKVDAEGKEAKKKKPTRPA